jgi:predicted SAM-dependent methyltransferase
MIERLNWGCGPDVREGWFNSDRDDYGQAHVGDILDGLPIADGRFDYAVANHSLQMIAWPDLPAVIGELARVLKPGGCLRVLVPDLVAAVHAYERGDAAHFLVPDALETSIDGKLCTYLTWAGTNRQVFTARWLVELLERHGFIEASPAPWGYSLSTHTPGILELDTRRPESIVVEAFR